jgi:hypothetical protein
MTRTIRWPWVLPVEFRQRAGSKLKEHRRSWRLRSAFEATSFRLEIAQAIRLIDLHKVLQYYTFMLDIGGDSFEIPLCKVPAPGFIAAVGGPAAYCTHWITPARSGKLITARLALNGKSDEFRSVPVPALVSRAEDGTGFRVRISIQGNKLCPKNDERRRANLKRSATPSR